MPPTFSPPQQSLPLPSATRFIANQPTTYHQRLPAAEESFPFTALRLAPDLNDPPRNRESTRTMSNSLRLTFPLSKSYINCFHFTHNLRPTSYQPGDHVYTRARLNQALLLCSSPRPTIHCFPAPRRPVFGCKTISLSPVPYWNLYSNRQT